MSKQQSIEDYINTVIGATVTTSALATATKCSLPTVLSYIKNNSHRFEKVKRGTYTIKAAALASPVSSDTQTHSHSSFEW